MRVGALAAMLTAAFAATPTMAQGVAAEYSPDDFVKAILSGPLPCPRGQTLDACEANPKTRRFTLAAPVVRESKSRPPSGSERLMRLTARPVKVTSSNVLVTFATGSAEITPQGQANLRSIAAGLNTAALTPISFEIAGFTDVTGAQAFNQALSRRRAEAVKAFLTALNVSPARLNAVGYGSEHLADPVDPSSEANRRVEMHRLN